MRLSKSICNVDLGKKVDLTVIEGEKTQICGLTKEYIPEILVKEESPLLFARCEGGIHLGECPNPPQECMEFWLKDRVIPENRQGLKEILLANGIHEYDWRVLIKLNHGRSVCDYYSVEVEEIDEYL